MMVTAFGWRPRKITKGSDVVSMQCGYQSPGKLKIKLIN